MADQEPIIKIHTEVDQKPLDKGLKEVKEKVKKTSEEGSGLFKDMFKALSLEKLVEKGLEIVTDFFKDSIEGAKEAELNTTKLQNALENVGASQALGAITEEAETLSKQFVVSKQEIIKSQTALITYGKVSGEQIKQLEPLIINYAKKTGKSMSEATDDIIKGLNGQGRELKKLGVNLESGGSAADNFGQLMDQLGPKVEGAADAFNKTSAGGLNKFKVTLEETEETIGAKLMPIIGDLIEVFTPLLDAIEPLIDSVLPILENIIKSTIIPTIKLFGDIIKETVIPVIELLGRIINIIVVAANKFKEALINLIKPSKDSSGAMKFFGDVIKGVVETLKKAYEWVSSLIDKVEDFLGIKHENKAKQEIEKTGEAGEEAGLKLIKAQNDVDKNAKKLAKKAEEAAKKAEEKRKKEADKALQEYIKEQDELEKIKDKYFSTERKKVAKGYDDDLEKLNITTEEGMNMYIKLSDEKAKALKKFDDEEALAKKQKLAKEKAARDQDAIDDLATQEALMDSKGDIDDKFLEKKRDAQLQLLKDQFDADLLNANLTADEKLRIEKKYNSDVLKLKKETSDKEEKLGQDTRDAELKIAQEGLNSLQSLSDLAFAIKDANLKKGTAAADKAARTEFKINKGIQMANATISAIMGVMNALDAESVVPDPIGSALKAANAIAVGIAGAANIAKIAGTQYQGSSATKPSTPSTPSISASQTMNIGTTPTTPTLYNKMGTQYQRVYVTQTDIAKTNNKVNVIQNRATIR